MTIINFFQYQATFYLSHDRNANLQLIEVKQREETRESKHYQHYDSYAHNHFTSFCKQPFTNTINATTSTTARASFCIFNVSSTYN